MVLGESSVLMQLTTCSVMYKPALHDIYFMPAQLPLACPVSISENYKPIGFVLVRL